MGRKLVKYFNLLHIALVYIAEALLILMVVVIFVNVVMRYVFNSGIVWSSEIALLTAVWFSFIAMALGVKLRLHIHINLLSEAHIPAAFDRLLWKIRDVVVVAVGVSMFWWGSILVKFTMRSILPATGMPAGVLYIVVPIAAVIIIYDGFAHLFGVDTEDSVVDEVLNGTLAFRNVLSGRRPTNGDGTNNQEQDGHHA
ncbi:MAG TPA: TRAP transporter small permease subunit [Spirochaetia bacterium]|nr:TRAP transporter small permease subunit [Spirochaetia bacterium]